MNFTRSICFQLRCFLIDEKIFYFHGLRTHWHTRMPFIRVNEIDRCEWNISNTLSEREQNNKEKDDLLIAFLKLFLSEPITVGA